jgi:sporulation protein YlmC with PRC-barrel domain
MTALKYSAATLALLLASGLAIAQTSTTQPTAKQGVECPAPGTMAEADMPAECKNQGVGTTTQAPAQDTSGTAAQDPASSGSATDSTSQGTAASGTTTGTTTQETTASGSTTGTATQDTTVSGTTTTEGTATTTTTQNQGVACPAPGTMAEADMPAECKDQAASGTTTDTTGSTSTTTTTTEVPKQDMSTTAGSDPAATGTTTEMPAEDQTATGTTTTQDPAATTATAGVNPSTSVLASQFMGQTVYSTANESVGEINDLVMSKELDNIVAIIGVGGFLGIGEKDVAIPIDQITATKDENNNLRLSIASTKEQLEAAPVFDRTALK